MNSPEMGSYLPRNELFSGLKGQNDDDILADDGDSVGFLIERKAGLEAEEVLKRERRLCLALLVAIAWVSVQLQVEAIWNQGNHHFSCCSKSVSIVIQLSALCKHI